MRHVRRLGLIDLSVLTVTGQTLGANLDWWEKSERRSRLRQTRKDRDGIDPAAVTMNATLARSRGVPHTFTIPFSHAHPKR